MGGFCFFSQSTSEDTSFDASLELERAIKENDVIRVKHYLVEHRGEFQVRWKAILVTEAIWHLMNSIKKRFDANFYVCSWDSIMTKHVETTTMDKKVLHFFQVGPKSMLSFLSSTKFSPTSYGYNEDTFYYWNYSSLLRSNRVSQKSSFSKGFFKVDKKARMARFVLLSTFWGPFSDFHKGWN